MNSLTCNRVKLRFIFMVLPCLLMRCNNTQIASDQVQIDKNFINQPGKYLLNKESGLVLTISINEKEEVNYQLVRNEGEELLDSIINFSNNYEWMVFWDANNHHLWFKSVTIGSWGYMQDSAGFRYFELYESIQDYIQNYPPTG